MSYTPSVEVQNEMIGQLASWVGSHEMLQTNVCILFCNEVRLYREDCPMKNRYRRASETAQDNIWKLTADKAPGQVLGLIADIRRLALKFEPGTPLVLTAH